MKAKKLIYLIVGLLMTSLCMAQELEIKMNGYGEKKLKKFPKKVYIKDFNVNFQMTADAKAVSKATTNSARGSTSTSMNVAVTGVDISDLQKITDDAYNEFVASLKSMGFEIVPVEVAGKAKFFEDHQLMESNINEDQNPGFLKVTPTGYKYYVKKVSKKGKEQQAGTPLKLIKELKDVLVVSANYSFSSIYLVAKQNTTLGTSSVKGKIGLKMPGCSISAWGGVMTALNFSPKKVPAFEGIFKGEGEKLKAFSMATRPTYDGFMTHSSTDYTHQAEAIDDKYQTTTSLAIQDFNKLALGELSSFFGG